MSEPLLNTPGALESMAGENPEAATEATTPTSGADPRVAARRDELRDADASVEEFADTQQDVAPPGQGDNPGLGPTQHPDQPQDGRPPRG